MTLNAKHFKKLLLPLTFALAAVFTGNLKAHAKDQTVSINASGRLPHSIAQAQSPTPSFSSTLARQTSIKLASTIPQSSKLGATNSMRAPRSQSKLSRIALTPRNARSTAAPVPGKVTTKANALLGKQSHPSVASSTVVKFAPRTELMLAQSTQPGVPESTPGTTTPGTTTPGTTTPGTTQPAQPSITAPQNTTPVTPETTPTTPNQTTPTTPDQTTPTPTTPTTPDQTTPTTPDQTTPTTPITPDQTTPTTPATPGQPVSPTEVEPGRATRTGPSYLGIGANIGLGSEGGLGDTSFTVLSKIGLLPSVSFRPSVLIGDGATILLPLTYDFSFWEGPTSEFGFSAAPFLGVGAAISTGDDSEVGLLLTGGIDIPLTEQFTATGSVNASVTGETAVGILLGVGYNFR